MRTFVSCIAVLGFGLACFELGYTIGNKSHKNKRHRSAKLKRLFYQLEFRLAVYPKNLITAILTRIPLHVKTHLSITLKSSFGILSPKVILDYILFLLFRIFIHRGFTNHDIIRFHINIVRYGESGIR